MNQHPTNHSTQQTNPVPPYHFSLGPIRCSTHSIPQLLAEVRQLLLDKSLTPRTILDLNAHIYNTAITNGALRDQLNAARIVGADGMSIVWSARLFGVPMFERCNMTESFRAFLQATDMPPTQALLVGCPPATAEAAAAHVNRICSHCRIIGTASGFLADQEYEGFFKAYPDVDLIFLGLGTPNSQRIVPIAATHCPQSVIWHAGAGTIHFFAGTMTEAPEWWRRSGLQWLHRLAMDPRAYWRRYLLGNPLFIARILTARLRNGRQR